MPCARHKPCSAYALTPPSPQPFLRNSDEAKASSQLIHRNASCLGGTERLLKSSKFSSRPKPHHQFWTPCFNYLGAQQTRNMCTESASSEFANTRIIIFFNGTLSIKTQLLTTFFSIFCCC